MAEIKAFRGLRYNPGKIRDLSTVFAPPYDVISSRAQEALYRSSPYNVIRLELGKEKPRDSVHRNKYTRARDFLERWKSEGVLIRENAPALYIYRQDYRDGRRVRSRVGFLAAMKVDKKAVLKHENTLAAPKKDRLALLKETRTNLSPIWGLFEDKDGRVKRSLETALKERPVIDITLDGVRHRLVVEMRPGVIRAIIDALRYKPMFIADGHHRFEVACQFRDWMRAQNPPGKKDDAPWDYVLSYFSDCVHNPLKIYPTHRLISSPKGMEGPLEALRKRGSLRKMSGLAEMMSKGKRLEKNRQDTPRKGYDFGIYTKKDGFYLFTLDNKRASGVRKDPVRSLDVSVLHRLILEPCFGIKAIEKSKSIDFTRHPAEACAKVRAREFDMAIFLRPTSLQEILRASKRGLKMPQKSTYFYPKLLSGLVFNGVGPHD